MQQSPRKPWYRRWWAWALGILVLLVIIGNLLPDTEDPVPSADPTETTTAETSPTPTRQATASGSPSPEVTSAAPTKSTPPSPTPTNDTTAAEPEIDAALAERVEAALLKGNAVDSFQTLQPTSPGYWISQIEDVSPGTVRVHMQAELTDAERDDAAHWVMNMSCMTVEDLDTVIIQDTTGVDSNHFKFSMERVLPICQG